MRVLFLGSGTSQGIPVIGCRCGVCRSSDPRNRRLRPSIVVESGPTRLLVDVTPDFRYQMLREGIDDVSAVLLTHAHADHFLGMDDLRAFTWNNGRRMMVYGPSNALEAVARVFPYACEPVPRWPTLPQFTLVTLTADEPHAVGDVTVRPVAVPHGKLEVFGYRFGSAFAYVTDCHTVPEAAIEAVRGVTVLVLDAVRHRSHPTHMTVEEAVAVARRVGAPLTLLTHMCHELDHAETQAALPAGVRLAYDRMIVEMDDTAWRVTR
jgi:phosphoribosyl 1,2-cyclic phosphate phosphodiesterase